MRIRYFCHYGRLTGYARAARDYLLALHDLDDVQLEIAVLGDDVTSPEPRYSCLDPLAVRFDRVMGTPDLEIYHAPPRVLAALTGLEVNARTPGGPRRVAIVTWETSALPDMFAEVLQRFDAVIVPSHFCAEVIGEAISPITPIHIVPHCFDEGFWPMPCPPAEDAADRPYRFYTIGTWGERKNPLGVLRAYLHEFTKDDNVELMLLSEGVDLDEVRSLIARSGIPMERLPALAVPTMDSPLTEEQLVELHMTADCFVTATRGEGWGLGMFEAAICGKAVIAPQQGGQLDFLAGYGRYVSVPYQLTPCFGAEQRDRVIERSGQTMQVSKVSLPPGVNCRQSWAEPDLQSLADSMFMANATVRSPDADRADRAALEALFGYKTVGPLLANLLRGIAWDSSSTHSTP